MYVHCALIAETIVLFILSVIFQGKKLAYLVSLVVLAAGAIVLIQIIPLFQTILDQVLGLVFGFSIYSVAVVETLPWTLTSAWENFTYRTDPDGRRTAVLGYIRCKEKNNQSVFLLVWSVVMLLLTIRFQRFRILFYGQCGSTLSAICIAETIGWREDL